jgi:predicted metalloendopeptidase
MFYDILFTDKKCDIKNDVFCYFNELESRRSNLFTDLQDQIDDEIYNFITKNNNSQFKILLESINKKKFYETAFMRNMISLALFSNDVKSSIDFNKYLIGYGINNLFNIYVCPETKGSNTYILKLLEPTLPLKPKYYKKSSTHLDNYARILRIIGNYLKGINNSINITTFVNDILEIESLIAYTKKEQYYYNNPNYTTNIITWSDLCKFYDNNDVLTKIFPKFNIIDVMNVDHLKLLSYFFETKNIKKMSNYLLYKVVCTFIDHLRISPKIIPNYNIKKVVLDTFKFFFRGTLNEYISNKYYDERTESWIYEYFELIKKTFSEEISSKKMFSKEATENFVNKCGNISIIYGSSRVQNYDYMITEDIFFSLSASLCKRMTHILEYVDKYVSIETCMELTSMCSYIVNATYFPDSNIIYIPTAMTLKPFFNIDDDLINNFGSIGTIISHEFCHAFDSASISYNYLSILNNWINNKKKDMLIYQKEINNINASYQNATNRINENCADVWAVNLTLLAYYYYNENDIDKETLIKYMDSWAKTFQNPNIYRDNDDIHSDDKSRINITMKHCNMYYKLFNIDESDAMYIPEKFRSKFINFNLWFS